jgi:hypothetical protein
VVLIFQEAVEAERVLLRKLSSTEDLNL